MKIEITKACHFSGKDWKVGQRAIVEGGLAMQQVDAGNAKSSEYVTEQEIYAESVSVEKAVDILEDMPRKSKDIIKKIKTITNKPALDMLLTDGRSSVRKAALIRLEEL